MKTIRESVIEAYLVKRCKELHIEVRKVEWPGRRGAPDRLLYVSGGVFVELKRPDRSYNLSRHQLREHEAMRNGGMKVYCVHTKDEVDNLIKEVTGGE